jgi:toxin-antitoxin system PIN domain toxin
VIAVDTNILVYAHREDSPFHPEALHALEGLAGSGKGWSVPWPCVHEFLAVVTHPRIYDPPSSVENAMSAIRAVTDLPNVSVLGESTRHLETLASLTASGRVVGPKIHDARIAAICLDHGVNELWTVDRDYSWFPQLQCVNPLVPQ